MQSAGSHPAATSLIAPADALGSPSIVYFSPPAPFPSVKDQAALPEQHMQLGANLLCIQGFGGWLPHHMTQNWEGAGLPMLFAWQWGTARMPTWQGASLHVAHAVCGSLCSEAGQP